MKISRKFKKKINHVAIIMDGNGRWAKKYKLSKRIGHKQGIKNCITLCKKLDKIDYNIDELSFYVFSTENWRRKPSEIKNLFQLIETFYLDFQNAANENNLRIRHLGSRIKLSKKLLNIIDDVTLKTKFNSGPFINLLFNYGSRKEITDAIVKLKEKKSKSIDIKKYFYIPESKDPDLIIRTGGQMRLSNFMLWQSAYTELYFTKVLWPDFKITNLNKALHNYSLRKRNLGK